MSPPGLRICMVEIPSKNNQSFWVFVFKITDGPYSTASASSALALGGM